MTTRQPRLNKVHLHSEQFDGWLHAECGAGDVQAPNPMIVGVRDFEATPRERRCRKCAAYWWPRGGEAYSDHWRDVALANALTNPRSRAHAILQAVDHVLETRSDGRLLHANPTIDDKVRTMAYSNGRLRFNMGYVNAFAPEFPMIPDIDRLVTEIVAVVPARAA